MVSKTIEIRKIITKVLKEQNINVYYEEADPKATFPYLVYELKNSPVYLNRDDFVLTIDIWDKYKTSERIEIIADNIEKLNNENKWSDGNTYSTFYLINRMSIRDEDKQIKRRQLIFEVKSYYIGE